MIVFKGYIRYFEPIQGPFHNVDIAILKFIRATYMKRYGLRGKIVHSLFGLLFPKYVSSMFVLR